MSLFLRRLAAGLIALSAVTALPVSASHMSPLSLSSTSSASGATASYTFQLTPSNNGINFGPNPIPAGQGIIEIRFPVGYDLSAASFNVGASGAGSCSGCTPSAYTPFPTHAATVDVVNRILRISAIGQAITDNLTGFRVVVAGVKNPSVNANYSIGVAIQYDAGAGPRPYAASNRPFSIVTPPGVSLDASPAAPLTYASEIIATPAAPVTLTNGGALNLITPLRYNFSSGEVRHARIECSVNLRFSAGSAVSYAGGGSASVGAINGLGSSAIYFSITANNASVSMADRLTVNGNRSITGNAPVSCTYGLYDQPSQAAAGGSIGRVASVTGSYIAFAPSTIFAAIGRTSVANVDADPAFTAFLVSAPTTVTTAALARLTYVLAAPAPLTAGGAAIALIDLHANGASGTRIVVDGDFTAAANANGSFSGAEARVYLSANNSSCTSAGGIPAAALSATQASFNVGATAADRMLCLAPLAGRAIPASEYTATLSAKSAAPSVYAVASIGPQNAGAITRNGTELQAPLVQVPSGYLARLVLTNTGGTAREYTIAVQGEDGNVISKANLTGTVPARGTRVIDLNTVLTGFTATPRATVNITIAGPNNQVQGLYQIVNQAFGAVSNHVLVRPGSN